MHMKKHIFSGKLYVQSLKRMRTVGIAMMICIVLINIVLPIDAIMANGRRYVDDFVETDIVYVKDESGVYEGSYEYYPVEDFYWADQPHISEIEDTEFAPALWALAFFAPLMVYLMFSFLNERHKADFYHALPHTRTCAYLSMIAAIFTWIFATILLTVGLNSVLYLFAKYYTFSMQTVLANVAFFSVLSLFMAGFAAFAMMVTGTAVSGILVFGYLLLFPPYAATIFAGCFQSIVSVLPSDVLSDTVLFVERYLPTAWMFGDLLYEKNLLSDVPVLIFSLIVSVLLFVLAGVCYRFRRSEMAGKSAPNGAMQHLYRILFTTAAAILIPFSICLDGFDTVLILLVVIVAVVYILYELLTTRKVSKMVRSLPLLIVPFLLAAAFGGAVYGAKAAVYLTSPEMEDVESVCFSSTPYGVYGSRKMEGVAVSEPALIEYAVNALHASMESEPYANCDKDYMGTYELTYTLKNGKQLRRFVRVTNTMWNAMVNSETLAPYYYSLPSWDEVTYLETNPQLFYYGDSKSDEWKKVWEALLEDFDAMTMEEKLRFLNDEEYHKDRFYVAVTVEWKHKSSGGGMGTHLRNFEYTLTPELTPKTVALLMESYGGDEALLARVNKDLHSTAAYEDVFFMLPQDGYAYMQMGSQMFSSVVSVDEHLLDEEGVYVLCVIGYESYWFTLTEEEVKALQEYPASVSGKNW